MIKVVYGKGKMRKALQLDMHASFLYAHAVIDISRIMLGERFRDKRNVDSDSHFLKGRKGLGDCL